MDDRRLKRERIFRIIALIVSVTGITFSNIIPAIWGKFNFVKREEAVKAIESVKITSNMKYIEQQLGIPLVKYDLYYKPNPDNYSTNENGTKDVIVGSKAIYNNQFYLLILYYSPDQTLFGYVLSQKDKKFTPTLLEGKIGFKKSMNDSGLMFLNESLFVYESAVERTDVSKYYLEFHYHHLETYGLHIGLGYSDLVERDDTTDYRTKWKNAIDNYEDINANHDNSTYTGTSIESGDEKDSEELLNNITTGIHPLTPNTIAVFDDSFIDAETFFENEFSEDPGITCQDYIIVNY